MSRPEARRAHSIVWLDDIAEADRARVGAKAWALARLRREGLPVPDGFVLPADAEEPEVDLLEPACARLGPVAVRSSAAAEDAVDASFAGQYTTVLDVRGASDVLAALRRCRAGQAAAYAAATGAATGEGTRISVLVQRFVEPRVAGVAFTRDPRDPASLVVESHAGRGEALVSGAVTPSRDVVDRATGAVRAGGGKGLAPADLDAVAALARKAEALFGSPQDVEWAIGGEGPVLLQSRPITVEGEDALDPRIERLTRANVGEVLPDPVTPLTASVLVALLEHGFQEVAHMAGLGDGGGAPFLVLHRERLYLNLTRTLEVVASLPGISPADAERFVLGAGSQRATPRIRAAELPRLAAILVRVARLGARLPARIVAAEEAVRTLVRRAEEAESGAADLRAVLGEVLATGRPLAATHIAVSGAGGVRLSILQRLVGRWLPGDAIARTNRLLAGLDGVESAAPALALEALAAEVRGRPDWRALLARPSPEDVLARGEGPPEFAARLGGFLARFGHRALSEGELRARTWREDPGPVLRALATLADSPRPAGFTQASAAEHRRAEEEAVFSRLGAVRGAILRRALEAARDGVRHREHTKSVAVLLVDAGRRVARMAGARLFTGGALEQADDVFFLSAEELAAALAGAPPSRPALRRRRRRHDAALSVPAPRTVDRRAGAGVVEGQATWRGTGVSPGVGMGPARVIQAGEAVHLKPGEVLVAPVLDAALGPLLASAAGAVAEIGGLLSHGAVVARELGVPCVVDVRDATRRIRTGDRVLVDGSTGEVRPWTDTPAASGAGTAAEWAPRASPEDEAFHALEGHPWARESVYVNAQDPGAGFVLVASLGARPAGRGEALLALGLPDGRIVFALELGPLRTMPSAVAVGGMESRWWPVRLHFEGRVSMHESASFPPGPLPLVLAPRTVEARIHLEFTPTTPAIDFTHGLPAAEREALRPVGAHHVEQSGRWHGLVEIDGRATAFDGTGSRDHSWGRRDWEAAEWWRLFTARFGDDLAVHALAVSVDGHLVEGGFVWRRGEVEPVRRVAWTAERVGSRVTAVEVELGTAQGPLRLRGQVERTVTVPVQLARRVSAHLQGRPWRLLLHENYTRYWCEGREGRGMAEITERP